MGHPMSMCRSLSVFAVWTGKVRSVRSVDWTDGGLVKRVRGVAYSTKVSPQVSNRCVHSARGVLNALLPDVYIFTG